MMYLLSCTAVRSPPGHATFLSLTVDPPPSPRTACETSAADPSPGIDCTEGRGGG